jgi:hypothetical protein
VDNGLSAPAAAGSACRRQPSWSRLRPEKLTAGGPHRSPTARLKALGDLLADQRDTVARYGCPYGTLSSELAKRRADGPNPFAPPLLQLQIDWAEQQFRDISRHDARALAVELVAALQGSTVLSNALGRPELMTQQIGRLHRWIDALERNTTS